MLDSGVDTRFGAAVDGFLLLVICHWVMMIRNSDSAGDNAISVAAR